MAKRNFDKLLKKFLKESNIKNKEKRNREEIKKGVKKRGKSGKLKTQTNDNEE